MGWKNLRGDWVKEEVIWDVLILSFIIIAMIAAGSFR